ncbi:Sterile alpha motif domain-containing protein 3 [Scomber scombrus]|uniref:Sterile alpha motif domain-containing protein 3 n=1 Tax=Scomber scombrus TaxID=13677 RepID=A0AAV1PR91_SCOSC
MLLRIILSENDIRKVTIDTLPETVHDFCSILKTKLGLEGDLVIQYQDPEFDNELCNLSSMSELPKDKATLKVHTKSSEYNTDSTLDTASLSSSSLEDSPHEGKAQSDLETERSTMIEAEFARLTSVDLKGSFFAGLDQYLARFLELYKAKSGIVGLNRLMRCLNDDSSTHRKRTVLLLGLPHFLKEDPSGFFKTVEATDEEDTFTKGMKVGVVMVKDGEEIIDTAVVLEEAVILSELKDIPRAIALLMGRNGLHTDRPADSLQSAMFKAKDGPISMTLSSSAKDSPPPNSYDVVKAFEKANGNSFSEPRNEGAKRRQTCFLSAAPRDDLFVQCDPSIPGPDRYKPSVNSLPQMALITSREDRFKVSVNTNPGPGSYQLSPGIMNSVLKGTFNVTLSNPLCPSCSTHIAPGPITGHKTINAVSPNTFISSSTS